MKLSELLKKPTKRYRELNEMNIAIGEKGLNHSWQGDFAPETKCCRCDGTARIGFVVQETDEKEYVCNLHSNDMGTDGDAWLHDAVAVAVYFCKKCLETTALYNQA